MSKHSLKSILNFKFPLTSPTVSSMLLRNCSIRNVSRWDFSNLYTRERQRFTTSQQSCLRFNHEHTLNLKSYVTLNLQIIRISYLKPELPSTSLKFLQQAARFIFRNFAAALSANISYPCHDFKVRFYFFLRWILTFSSWKYLKFVPTSWRRDSFSFLWCWLVVDERLHLIDYFNKNTLKYKKKLNKN